MALPPVLGTLSGRAPPPRDAQARRRDLKHPGPIDCLPDRLCEPPPWQYPVTMPPSDASEAPDQNVAPAGQTSVSAPEAEDEDRAILAQLTIGSVVDGKYKVDRVLGRGAMGVVIQATHVHLGEK